MKIIVQNLAIEYQDDGHGRVMLFLHGWQDDLHTFDAIASALSKTVRVIRLDLPGFGKSEVPKEPWDLDNYVKFVKDFIQKLDLEVDTLVGHSFGGRIIIKGEASRMFRVQKIVLIGSAGIAKRRALRNATLKIFAKIGGSLLSVSPFLFWKEKLRKRIYQSIGSDYLGAGALKTTFLNIISEDLSMSAKNMTTPTLLIWGDKDTETPLSDGKRLSQLIPHAEWKVISKAGHFVHREKSQEVVAFMQAFL